MTILPTETSEKGNELAIFGCLFAVLYEQIQIRTNIEHITAYFIFCQTFN